MSPAQTPQCVLAGQRPTLLFYRGATRGLERVRPFPAWTLLGLEGRLTGQLPADSGVQPLSAHLPAGPAHFCFVSDLRRGGQKPRAASLSFKATLEAGPREGSSGEERAPSLLRTGSGEAEGSRGRPRAAPFVLSASRCVPRVSHPAHQTEAKTACGRHSTWALTGPWPLPHPFCFILPPTQIRGPFHRWENQSSEQLSSLGLQSAVLLTAGPLVGWEGGLGGSFPNVYRLLCYTGHCARFFFGLHLVNFSAGSYEDGLIPIF